MQHTLEMSIVWWWIVFISSYLEFRIARYDLYINGFDKNNKNKINALIIGSEISLNLNHDN